MRNPENVLKSLSEKAENREYRYERLYRNLYNPEFYLLAYQNIAKSQGSMTAGADGQTLDGMSMERIERIIAKIRDHSYQPNPARRVYIAKKNSNKKRPLGVKRRIWSGVKIKLFSKKVSPRLRSRAGDSTLSAE